MENSKSSKKNVPAQGNRASAPNPAFVDYGFLIFRLLKASRVRRSQFLRSGGKIKQASEVYDYQTTSIHGAPQSGKTRFIKESFIKDWSTSIVILFDDQKRAEFLEQMPDLLKASSELEQRVMTAQQVLDELKLMGPTPPEGAVEAAEGQDRRVKVSFQLDPNDADPAATIALLLEDFHKRREALQAHSLPITHPLGRPLNTVYVDDHYAQTSYKGLTFPRLVRYLRAGRNEPEIILL